MRIVVLALCLVGVIVSVAQAAERTPRGDARPARSAQAPAPAATIPSTAPGYAGSASCKTCHAEVYERWSKTRMANVVRDPRQHPDAIIPDLSVPNPLV
ncbi:MAG: hypothetical protein ABI880_00790, partial [Acidobacteriota bacterium]